MGEYESELPHIRGETSKMFVNILHYTLNMKCL